MALGFAAAIAFTLCGTGPETGTPARAEEPSATETATLPAVAEALAEAERLIAAGLPVVAFAVLFQTMEALPEGADDAPLRFGIAQALMAGGRLAQAEQVLDADWRVGVVPRIWTTYHDDQPGEVDPVGRSPDLSVSRRAGPGWLTLGGTLARETADRSSLDWQSRGLSLTYAADVGEDWSGSVRLGLSTARFDEADAIFLKPREDRTRSIGLRLSHRKLSWEGYQFDTFVARL